MAVQLKLFLQNFPFILVAIFGDFVICAPGWYIYVYSSLCVGGGFLFLFHILRYSLLVSLLWTWVCQRFIGRVVLACMVSWLSFAHAVEFLWMLYFTQHIFLFVLKNYKQRQAPIFFIKGASRVWHSKLNRCINKTYNARAGEM